LGNPGPQLKCVGPLLPGIIKRGKPEQADFLPYTFKPIILL
jgi:hypothetical protein